VRLPARPPFDCHGVLRFLGARAVPGVEAWDGTQYRRALDLPHGHGVVECRACDGAPALLATFRLADLRDLAPAVARVRRLFDLDADPLAVAEVLGADPLLAASLRARPGLRCAASVDPHEMLVRAIVGQQVSVAGARTVVGRLASAYGEPLALSDPDLTHLFPTVARLADLDPATASMPAARSRALAGACAALAAGTAVLHPGVDRAAALEALERVPGIGPWTLAYVAMRGLGDPDVLPASDLGVRRAMGAAGLPTGPARIEELGRAWRPWRSYATVHLWAGPVRAQEGAAIGRDDGRTRQERA
jgi:AraC family transcriptional regulator of adaptative response / DNA-3-methyladenine glycosylase II